MVLVQAFIQVMRRSSAPATAGAGRACQYSEASMIVSTRTVCFGSLGSSLP